LKREELDRALFDRIALKYARKDLFASASVARRHRLAQTLRHVRIDHDMDILEVGCGAGFAAKYLRGQYRSYTGIDYSTELIRYASAQNGGANVSFQAISLYDYQPSRQFDLVLMIGVLHHMSDMPRAVAAMQSLLKPGGYLAVNEPQRSNGLIRGLRRARAALDPAYSDDQEELDPAQLAALFGQAGLTDVRTIPQGLFSTPFAEVVLKPQFITAPLARLACAIDLAIEDRFAAAIAKSTWNVIVIGRK